jgi:hypothetical protein
LGREIRSGTRGTSLRPLSFLFHRVMLRDRSNCVYRHAKTESKQQYCQTTHLESALDCRHLIDTNCFGEGRLRSSRGLTAVHKTLVQARLINARLHV